MSSDNRTQSGYAPLRSNNPNQYGTNDNNNPLDPDGEDSLFSFSRLKRSFTPSQGSVYIVSSAIVGLVILGSLAVILFLGITRVFNPHKGGLRYMDPNHGFDKLPSTESLRANLRHITSQPHLAGKGKDLAKWYQARLKGYGLETEIETYYPYLNYPVQRRLAIVEPKELIFEAKLTEQVVDEDKTSQDKNAVPTFHGYSASGNVTSQVVYANYGTLDDFKLLEANRISVKGKIALVRYGKCFRGLKVRAAELHGAVGVLIYSDPADDGFEAGQVYPEGPFRPGSGVQRGSVMYLSLAPGDPLTPGTAATKHADRIKLEDSKTLPKIPSLPISYDDAYPILHSLAGEGKRAVKLNPDWEGGLDLPYWTGPSEAKINLVNIVKGDVTPIYNVIATIPGSIEPERQIIVGNHRDAWVFGAVDPGSGSTTMLEVARTLGNLLKRGWKPRRTIKLCSWDAEEYGLVGSTEWVEDHAKELSRSAVAYINVDGFEGTDFNVQGTPSLYHLLANTTQQVQSPSGNGTLFDNWQSQTPATLPKMEGLGSGSDFTPFYQHLGIASINLGFSKKSGVYHSNYDSFHYVEKFSDPLFKSHLAMTQLLGKLTIHLADNPIVPFNLTHYAQQLKKETEDLDASLSKKPFSKLGFNSMYRALAQLTNSTTNLHSTESQLQSRFKLIDHKLKCPSADSECIHELQKLNDQIALFERSFLIKEGLNNREFYKHSIYAPGLWAGYQTQLFPALNEAIDDKDFKLATQAVKQLTNVFYGADQSLQQYPFEK